MRAVGRGREGSGEGGWLEVGDKRAGRGAARWFGSGGRHATSLISVGVCGHYHIFLCSNFLR